MRSFLKKYQIVIFVVLVLTSGWIGKWIDSRMESTPEQGSLGLLLWLIMPLVASLLLRAFVGDGWKDLGIRPVFKGNIVWYAVSILFFPACAAIVIVFGLGLGAVSFPDLSSSAIGAFAQAVAIALIAGFVKNIFEEFAWRGYLAPKMYALQMNILTAHLLVGAIWAAWHIPYWLYFLESSDLQSFTTQSLAIFMLLGSMGIIVSSIAYGEIRIRTNSVWPAVLMHTAGNAFVNTLFILNFIQVDSDMEILASPGQEGILSIALFTLIGGGLYIMRNKNRVA